MASLGTFKSLKLVIICDIQYFIICSITIIQSSMINWVSICLS